ncbi:hypothetical protein ACHAQH_007736 [Verticillium albo-atrum]
MLYGQPPSSVSEYEISSEVEFDFAVRIPDWTTSRASLQVNNKCSKRIDADSSSLQHIPIPAGQTNLTLVLPMEVRTETRNSSIGIYYGPLLYALDLPFTQTEHQPLNWTDRKPLADEDVHPKARDHVLKPTGRWQYAIDPESVHVVESGSEGEGEGEELPSPIFTRDGPPTFLTVDAWEIDWVIDGDSAAWPPINPVVEEDKKTKIKLIPYGAVKLHVAQFPVVKVA